MYKPVLTHLLRSHILLTRMVEDEAFHYYGLNFSTLAFIQPICNVSNDCLSDRATVSTYTQQLAFPLTRKYSLSVLSNQLRISRSYLSKLLTTERAPSLHVFMMMHAVMGLMPGDTAAAWVNDEAASGWGDWWDTYIQLDLFRNPHPGEIHTCSMAYALDALRLETRKQNLTKKALGQEADMNAQTVSKILSSAGDTRMPLDSYLAIVRALGYQPDEWFAAFPSTDVTLNRLGAPQDMTDMDQATADELFDEMKLTGRPKKA